ncbi:MAG: PorV/PorQ family protein [Elusimicrobiota bacterium]
MKRINILRNGPAAALTLCLFAAARPAFADKIHPQAGTGSAAFLKTGVGARPVAMGEAYTAAADDVHAVYWNPAGLAGSPWTSFTYMFHDSIQDIRHDFIGFSRPRRDSAAGGVWGLSLISVRVPDDLERRAGANENDPFNPLTSSEGSFGASDLALGVSYAQFLREDHSIGITGKFIRQSIDEESAQTAALDLGWQRRRLIPKLDLGAVLQNLGPGIKFGQRYPLPLTLKIGAAYRMERRNTLLVFDIAKPRDNYPILAWGVESQLLSMLYVRAGYRYRWFGNTLGAISGVRTGAGISVRRFTLDYAFAPFGELGKTHRISLGYGFGKKAEPVSAEKAAAKRERQKKAAKDLRRKQVVQLAPVPPAIPQEGYTAFPVETQLKTLSSQGSVFRVKALAPDSSWTLRRIEFHLRARSADGLTVGVRRAEAQEPLPQNLKAREAVWLKRGGGGTVRAPRLIMKAPAADAGEAIFGLYDGKWRPLRIERFAEDGQDFVRVLCDGLPDAVAVVETERQDYFDGSP